MEHTPHIFLSGPEVEQFAVQQGHSLVDNASLTTDQRRQQWERQKEEDRLAHGDEIVQTHVGHNTTSSSGNDKDELPSASQQQQQQQDERHCQTVGAVAIDSRGRLAAATSTGGRTNKVRRGVCSVCLWVWVHGERVGCSVPKRELLSALRDRITLQAAGKVSIQTTHRAPHTLKSPPLPHTPRAFCLCPPLPPSAAATHTHTCTLLPPSVGRSHRRHSYDWCRHLV